MAKIMPVAVAFILCVVSLIPSALTLPQHPDESVYGWSSAYFGGKLARLDMSPYGTHEFFDPGWSSSSVWNLTGPTATRLVYGIALAVTSAPAPTLPYHWGVPALQGPETQLEWGALLVLRAAAIVCAALAFALLAARWGWQGTAVACAMLAIPAVREDFARAWAESPLLLGIAVCAVAYGSRWFAPACGLAATFKLTALGLWPLVFWRGAIGKSQFAHLLGVAVTWLTWSALTPQSWFAGGPFYLVQVIAFRLN